MVHVLTTKKEFDETLEDNKDKLVVVDFYSDWCGPCRVIAPKFEALLEDPKCKDKVVFLKVNVDDAEEIAESCGISALPTFQFYRDGKKVDEFSGAIIEKIVALLYEHMK